MFAGIINIPRTKPPVRAYLHSSGMQGAYGTSNILGFATEYLRCCINKDVRIYRDYHMMLYAMIWANREHRMLDLFALRTAGHTENPDVNVYHYCNGVLLDESINLSEDGKMTSDPPILTCGDSLITLGGEERARRKRVSLEEHLIKIPTFQPNEVDGHNVLTLDINEF